MDVNIIEAAQESKIRRRKLYQMLSKDRVSRHLHEIKNTSAKKYSSRQRAFKQEIGPPSRISEITHPIKLSHLHTSEYSNWLRSRYGNTASTDYIFTPEEVNRRLALRSIFNNFDDDGNGQLEIDEFLGMFIKIYVYDSAPHKLFQQEEEEVQARRRMSTYSLSLENRVLEIEKQKKKRNRVKVLKIKKFLREKFLQYYTFVTKHDYLSLDDFVALTINEDASEFFKNTMLEMKELLTSLDIQPAKAVPLEFDLMIDYLGYASLREQKLKEYNKFMKRGNSVKAFAALSDLFKINPKVHFTDNFKLTKKKKEKKETTTNEIQSSHKGNGLKDFSKKIIVFGQMNESRQITNQLGVTESSTQGKGLFKSMTKSFGSFRDITNIKSNQQSQKNIHIESKCSLENLDDANEEDSEIKEKVRRKNSAKLSMLVKQVRSQTRIYYQKTGFDYSPQPKQLGAMSRSKKLYSSDKNSRLMQSSSNSTKNQKIYRLSNAKNFLSLVRETKKESFSIKEFNFENTRSALLERLSPIVSMCKSRRRKNISIDSPYLLHP